MTDARFKVGAQVQVKLLGARETTPAVVVDVKTDIRYKCLLGKDSLGATAWFDEAEVEEITEEDAPDGSGNSSSV